MDNKDKLAIWSFGILIVNALGNFLNIYEFGSFSNYINYIITSFSFFTSELILLTQLTWSLIAIIASIYLFIVYPIKLIKEM